MSVARLTARCSAAQAEEPGGSSAPAGLADERMLGAGLGGAEALGERSHAVALISTANPNKAAQSGRSMRSA
jgi:hypothetical protein